MNMLDHLKSRHFDISLYKNITIGIDTVTFPLYNLSGEYVGYQQYRPLADKTVSNFKEGRYYTYITKLPSNTPKVAVWGLDSINTNDSKLYITEEVFKACRLHNLGLNAVAVLGNNPKHLANWLYSLPYDIVAVCDGDLAGRNLASYSTKHSVLLPYGKYLDEMSNLEVINLIGKERLK